jgi:hypothetical protein
MVYQYTASMKCHQHIAPGMHGDAGFGRAKFHTAPAHC